MFTVIAVNNVFFSQKIEPGNYVSVISYDKFIGKTIYNGEFSEEITFLDSINFKYRYRDDIENEIGFGKYTQGMAFLKLEFFDKPINFDIKNFVITDSSLSTNDTIKVKLKLTDSEGPLIGAYIAYWKESEKILSKPSNKNGIAYLNISKQDLGGLLQISYVGYETVKSYLYNEYNKNINIHLKIPFNIIPKGKILTYSIKDVDDDGFYVIGSIFSDWTFFKREE